MAGSGVRSPLEVRPEVSHIVLPVGVAEPIQVGALFGGQGRGAGGQKRLTQSVQRDRG